ncbi:MAG: LysM peptidoglycan-binding domain-containing protein [Kofleriaceae bacterium]
MKHRSFVPVGLALVTSSALGGVAAAQPIPTNPVEAPPLVIGPTTRRVDPPAPTPTPTPTRAEPDIRVITLGPDGRPLAAAAAADQPRYYYGDPDPDEGRAYGGITPELHTVVRGDTLWDISWYYFNDPWQWPKVWSYNPQISNPHWIYPGDLVQLLPRGVYVPVTTADPEGDPVRTSMPGPVRRSSLTLRDVAFVDAVDLEEAVRIDGSPDEKLLLATGDSVYLAYPKDKPPTIGERLSIYKEEQAVAKDGKKAGAYVRILGEVEVVSVKKDKARAA